MTASTSPLPPLPSARRQPGSSRSLPFSVPARHNPRLQTLVDRISADEELHHLWRCANVNASERLGLGEHGETHARIVANAGLRLLRLLLDGGYRSDLVDHHGLARADAEIVIVLAAALHDLGLIALPANPTVVGLPLAQAKAAQLLEGLYGVRERTALMAEALHAIAAHHLKQPALTLEGNVLTLADVLDLSKGRVNTAQGSVDAVDSVSIVRGEKRPVRVDIQLSHPDAVTVVVERLNVRLAHMGLIQSLEFCARAPGQTTERFWLPRQA